MKIGASINIHPILLGMEGPHLEVLKKPYPAPKKKSATKTTTASAVIVISVIL
jgi:hypothetical protein